MLRQSYARTLQGGWQRTADKVIVFVVETGGGIAGKAGIIDFYLERYFAPAYKSVGGAVGRNFHKFALNFIAASDPNAQTIAIAGVGVAGIGICLLHGAIGVKDEHVVLERRIRRFYKPGADNAFTVVGIGVGSVPYCQTDC